MSRSAFVPSLVLQVSNLGLHGFFLSSEKLVTSWNQLVVKNVYFFVNILPCCRASLSLCCWYLNATVFSLDRFCGIFFQCNAWTCTLKWSLVPLVARGFSLLTGMAKACTCQAHPGLGTGDRSESVWPCVLSWFDVEANSVVGRGSGWNEGSWSLHFIIFPRPVFPPACCSVCVESRGCQLMVRTNPTGRGGGRRCRTHKERHGNCYVAAPHWSCNAPSFACIDIAIKCFPTPKAMLPYLRILGTQEDSAVPSSYVNLWWNSRSNVLHLRLFSGIVYMDSLLYIVCIIKD